MADEYLENTTPAGGDVDEQFDVQLPVAPEMDGQGATHVARMRGNEAEYVDVLAEFVRTGSPASAPLRSAVVDSTLEELTFALNGLGPARVESIDPI